MPYARPVAGTSPSPSPIACGDNEELNADSTACLCITGFGRAEPGASCTQCAAGTARGAGDADDVCLMCTDNTYSAPGAATCSACSSGQIANNDHTACGECARFWVAGVAVASMAPAVRWSLR